MQRMRGMGRGQGQMQSLKGRRKNAQRQQIPINDSALGFNGDNFALRQQANMNSSTMGQSRSTPKAQDTQNRQLPRTQSSNSLNNQQDNQLHTSGRILQLGTHQKTMFQPQDNKQQNQTTPSLKSKSSNQLQQQQHQQPQQQLQQQQLQHQQRNIILNDHSGNIPQLGISERKKIFNQFSPSVTDQQSQQIEGSQPLKNKSMLIQPNFQLSTQQSTLLPSHHTPPSLFQPQSNKISQKSQSLQSALTKDENAMTNQQIADQTIVPMHEIEQRRIDLDTRWAACLSQWNASIAEYEQLLPIFPPEFKQNFEL